MLNLSDKKLYRTVYQSDDRIEINNIFNNVCIVSLVMMIIIIKTIVTFLEMTQTIESVNLERSINDLSFETHVYSTDPLTLVLHCTGYTCKD